MLNYSIKINGTELDVATGFVEIERLDEALDSMTMTIPFSLDEKPFKQWDRVDFTFDGMTRQYFVASDEVAIASKNPLIYEHTITMVELTKKLERTITSPMSTTQPLDATRYTLFDVLEKIRRTEPFITISEQFTNRLFVVSDELKAQTDNIKAPQFFFKDLTVRECIDGVLSYINSIGRIVNINGVDTLIADNFNTVKKLITLDNMGDINRIQDIKEYATNILSKADNLIQEQTSSSAGIVYPDKNGWITPRSSELELNTDNIIYKLPSNINSIIKVEAFVEIRVGTTSEPIPFFETYDISKYVIEENLWNTIPISPNNDFILTGDVVKNNTIRWKQGDDNLFGLGDVILVGKLEPDRTALENVLITTIHHQLGFTSQIVVFPNNKLDLFSVMLRITYDPVINTVIKIPKGSSENVNKQSTIISNQRDSLIDIDKYVNSLRGQIQRLGNQSIKAVTIHKDPSGMLEIGDFTNEGFIVTVVKKTYEIDHILAEYELSKDFNRLNQFIGVNSELRQFEIPFENQLVERHLIYDDYIEVSTAFHSDTSGLNNNTSLLTTSGVQTFMNTLVNQESPGVTAALFKNTDTQTKIGVAINSVGAGNIINFDIALKDNQLASDEVVTGLNEEAPEKPFNQGVRYTVFDSTLNNFSIGLYGETKLDNLTAFGFSNATLKAKRFPNINESDYLNLLISNEDDVFVLEKDPAERILLTYSLNIVVRDNGIVVGRNLAKFNNITNNPPTGDLFLWRTIGQKYTQFNDLKVKDNSFFSLSPISLVVDNSTIFIDVVLPSDIKPEDSWAIADSSGNLYLAANDPTKSRVYFAFRKNRTGVEQI